jgi:outer membrane protein assembly factor BamA
VITRELRTLVGQPLDPSTLTADVQRLQNLDIFSSVCVELVSDGEAVRVVYHLRELPPVVPYITYDVTDQDGWSFGPAVKSVNLFGKDIFLAGYALFGGRTSYLLDLTHPWMFGDHVSFDLDASRIVRQNEFDGFEERSTEFTPRLGTWIGDHGRASVAVSLLRFESDLAGHTLSATDTDDLLRIGGSVGYDSRDDWSNPAVGWLVEVETWKTGGVIPGEGDFWTLHLDSRRFQPVVAGQTLVLASLLSVQSGRVGRDLPQYMDYHLGGANSLRGYTVDDLGHSLFGKGLQDRLADPPYGIGDEFEAAGLVETFDRLEETDVALGDQFDERQTVLLVAARDTDNKAEIRCDDLLPGILVASFGACEQLEFLRTTEGLGVFDFFPVELHGVHRIVTSDSSHSPNLHVTN